LSLSCPAGSGCTTANTVVGYLACGGAAGCNTIMGHGAGKVLSSGGSNTAMGHWAMCANTTGYRNTALGFSAMCRSILSFNNTAIGWQAGREFLCAAAYNVAVGDSALMMNISGVCNVGIGHYAVCATNYGGSNVGIGAFALQKNTFGCFNTAVGEYAGWCTCGNTCKNVFVGYRAGCRVSSGACNIAIESEAQNNLTGTYHNTIAIGERSCATASNMAVFGGINTNCVCLKGKVDFRICCLTSLP
jgi:hypothetical protein